MAGLLTACAGQQIEAGMNRAVGRPISVVIAVLGNPDADGSVAGRKVYVWQNQYHGTMVLPETNYTTGVVGGQLVSLQNTQYVSTDLDFSCRIRVFLDDHDIVQSWDYRGNQGGCAPYARQLAQIDAVAPLSLESDWMQGYNRGIHDSTQAVCDTPPPGVGNGTDWSHGCQAGSKDR
jgi:hypothetical protein